jgi:hypothetical protein
MSDERSDRKTLLPEFLPRPQVAAGASPAERVAARARSLLERWKRLGPVAGAAVLSVHCSSYGVVDPLPPPPGQCREAPDNEVFTFTTEASFEEAVGVPSRMVLTLVGFDRIGYQFGTPQVRGGKLVSVEDQSSPSRGAQLQMLQIMISVAALDAEVFLDLDIGCEGRTTTKHYRLRRSVTNPRLVDVEELK